MRNVFIGWWSNPLPFFNIWGDELKKPKIFILFLSAFVLFLYAPLNSFQKVEANVVKTTYKVADGFVKGFVQSVSSKKGIHLDINDFLKADGSIDWNEYEKQQELLANIFYKGVQDGAKNSASSVKTELKKVMAGETDVVTKTPLKGLPGWSKVVISAGAAVTGADLLFDIYQYATGGSGSDGSLETIDNKLTTLVAGGTSGVQSMYPLSSAVSIGESSELKNKYSQLANVTIFGAKTWSSPAGMFEIDIVTHSNALGSMTTTLFINKYGYASYQTVGFGFEPSQMIMSLNADESKMNVFLSNASDKNKFYYVQTGYNGNTVDETYRSGSDYYSSYGGTLASAVNWFGQAGIYYISNVIGNGTVPEAIPTIVADPLPLKQTLPSTTIGSNGSEEVFIVPEGLTQEQIQQQVQATPEIMTKPEEFLQENPQNKPDEGEGELEGGPACSKDMDLAELEALGSTLSVTFPFSIPFDLLNAIDAVFGGVGNERPEFKYDFVYLDKEYSWNIKLPEYFDTWKPFTDGLLVFIFDIGILYAIFRFTSGR